MLGSSSKVSETPRTLCRFAVSKDRELSHFIKEPLETIVSSVIVKIVLWD